jgi:hypothetical protein
MTQLAALTSPSDFLALVKERLAATVDDFLTILARLPDAEATTWLGMGQATLKYDITTARTRLLRQQHLAAQVKAARLARELLQQQQEAFWPRLPARLPMWRADAPPGAIPNDWSNRRFHRSTSHPPVSRDVDRPRRALPQQTQCPRDPARPPRKIGRPRSHDPRAPEADARTSAAP